MMRIQPKTRKEAWDIVLDILNQGDSRYNNTANEVILADFLVLNAISLEEKEIPFMEEPKLENENKFSLRVQREEKLLVREMLKSEGFQDKEILFEQLFSNGRADVLAESPKKTIAVECCSCRIDKIINYLEDGADEVWVTTIGLPPWEKIKYLKENMGLFVFKKGPNWDKVFNRYKNIIAEEMKKVKSPIDILMEEKEKNKSPLD